MGLPSTAVATPGTSSSGPAISRRYAWVVFALSFGLLLSDYMSRQVLNAVFPQLKAQWLLSDAKLGSLSSVVALMVGLLTFPMSLRADRWGRVRSLVLAAVVWSVATLGCALAANYGQLLLGRLFVGVGEAAYGSVGIADVPFDHPLWILWSSGTTGVPKGIVQGHGGITVELLKALGLGADLRPEDRYLFVTSTSWMVWNFLVGGLLFGCTVILYDGSPTHPDVDGAWRVAERTGATVVGVGAAYLTAGEQADARPAENLGLNRLRTILQTGSALPPSTWRWAHDRLPGVWLQSICGGTDVCSVLAGGSALLPVHVGRLQAPALGVALAAWDPDGRPLTGEQGELVVTAPMPSMPLRFVDDPDGDRYRAAYFDAFPGVWRHGDWVTVHPDLSVTVSGRSDSTLNRMGVRMGSADIYAVVEQLPEIADSLVLGVELPNGGYSMPLFVVTAADSPLDDELRARIKAAIRRELSPRHVPDTVVRIAAVPRTLTGKKLEVPVKRILQGADVAQVSSSGAVTHPDMLDWFAAYAARAASTAPVVP